MAEDPKPVDPDEIIFRRIPRCDYQADLDIPILPTTFSPKEADSDGLSFFRERMISPETILRKWSRSPAEKYQ